MYTTLNQIRDYGPFNEGWKKLLRNLGKTKSDDEPLALSFILESNGFDDALWCLRSVKGHSREMRLFAVDCARSFQHLMTDERSVRAIDVAERHAYGEASDEELAAASDAAWDVAYTAAKAATKASASVAAWVAAWVAARVTAWDAAWVAAELAARVGSDDVQVNLFALMCAQCEQE